MTEQQAKEQAIQKDENSTIDNLSITTIRTLAIDAIEKAKSGHPGMPMGSAPMGYQLFAKTMTHNPDHPTWVNRDRFVLSAGHGSMLLYSLLHLSGYDLPMEELKQFRQWGSLTPGHPEFGHTAGVDATTGPLGQGIAMAVGMAIAEAQLGATYNKDQYNVIDHYTYAICGDGDLMEGISSEAASLAGHLKLGKLVVLYDSNDISLDGKLNLAFSENVAQRFEAYGWQVLRVEDGNDLPAISKAIAEGQAVTDKPTLIEVKTIIGYGSPNKQGKGGHGGTHGSPLGAEEAKLTKEFYKWVYEEDFYVPDEVRAHFAEVKEKGIAANKAWDEKFAAYKQAYPELAAQFETVQNGDLKEGWDAKLPFFTAEDKAVSTRVASGNALNGLTEGVPQLFGGSADLESSTMTHLNGLTSFTPESYDGRNIYFGVREFGMAAAMNGIALHSGLKVFGGTFFVFTDYLRPAVRLAAIMKLPVTYVLTHDSIAVGEDGPTHEPIEQLASLRIIPGLTVIRPADANETSAAWAYAMENKSNPVALVLTRQNLPILPGTVEGVRENIKRGGYVVSEAKGKPQAQLIATGSEVQLAVKAQAALAEQGIDVRVISLPSWDLFEKQDKAYRDSVILPDVKARLAIEMAQTFGWERYTGDQGDILGITTFGASAPGDTVIKEYGFTVENVVSRVKALL
ncbi:transketolase [Paenibacillus sp. HN-1]|uniref:transketolase n=1 Tax=Paenibacillus TaxID=44249 RepID=UPI001CA9A2A3|nr:MULTISPECIES: transketolase [Paenibacillus]MBY9080938.1 transketolase [Paenibacillus sp. CGMCC 1.18879]MBY9085070.1 transketolase [Paenibacillus sinensis]